VSVSAIYSYFTYYIKHHSTCVSRHNTIKIGIQIPIDVSWMSASRVDAVRGVRTKYVNQLLISNNLVPVKNIFSKTAATYDDHGPVLIVHSQGLNKSRTR
jgi:hypothetical protein